MLIYDESHVSWTTWTKKHVKIYHMESNRLVAQGGRIRFTGQNSHVE